MRNVHMRTRARTHTETGTRANASPSLSLPNPHTFPSLLKGRTQGRVHGSCSRWRWHPMADQMRVLGIRAQCGQGGGSRLADFHAGQCFVCLQHPRQIV
jgi:hypothetical protein